MGTTEIELKRSGTKRKERDTGSAENKVEKMAEYGLNNREIADILEYDENTLKRHFEIFLVKGRANLRQKLKRKQIDIALKGNVAMLIWLGKQYLEQADNSKDFNELKVILERKELGN
ncbi:MAG: hypothetical protein HUU54_02590 [Ignavibacteriaceae bacterium]|nr:hypothetical protein [Ignavibacteriaceae bacterium]